MAKNKAYDKMNDLCKMKDAYLEISKKDYDELPESEKLFIDNFNNSLNLMELELDSNGNFQNRKNSRYANKL